MVLAINGCNPLARCRGSAVHIEDGSPVSTNANFVTIP
jgi:hypothetical protein